MGSVWIRLRRTVRRQQRSDRRHDGVDQDNGNTDRKYGALAKEISQPVDSEGWSFDLG